MNVKSLIARKAKTAINVIVKQIKLTRSDVLICCICSLALLLLGVSSRFSIWDLMEIFGAGIVATACWGEFLADFGNLVSKSEKAKEFLGKISTLILILGLVIELCGFVANLQISERLALSQRQQIEALRDRSTSNELAVVLVSSNNLILRSNVVWLEKLTQPREIKTEQKAAIVRLLGTNHNDTEVSVYLDRLDDIERVFLGKQVEDVFKAAGFKTSFGGWERIQVGGVAKFAFGLQLQVNPTNPSPVALEIFTAFRVSGVEMYLDPNPVLPPSKLRVEIGFKTYFKEVLQK